MVKKAAQATPNRLLRAARQERGWTQKDVADRIGAPLSVNVSRWEKGTVLPSAYYIQQLCALFGKSARELGLLLEEPTKSNKPTTETISSPLWTMPFRRNPFFTGREEILKQLHDRLTASRTATVTQTQAITGLGGIGKTQIAVEYTYRHREEYRAVLWIRAASRDALISDIATLASLLQLPERDEQDQNKVVAAVKRWLTFHQGWLLVLDNADDLDLVADLLSVGDNGHILLTTRAQATGSVAPSTAVEKMDLDEGTLLLLRRAKILSPNATLDLASTTNRSLARGIVEAMDGLPLALDQAGAYIEEVGCDLSEYLQLYHTHRLQLLQRRSMLPSDHPEPVASTWALSFLKVEQASPAAADLLRLCAFLDSDAISEIMIAEGAVHLGPPLETVASDPFKLNSALEVLRKFSLVRRNHHTNILTIHRLVQTVLKDRMGIQAQRQWAERAVRVVNHGFPEVAFEVWQRCQQYLPHAQGCAELIEQYHLNFPEAAHLLRCAGAYLLERALYAQAEPFLQRALAIFEQTLGPEHPEVIRALNGLALLYWYQGRYEYAEPFLQRALMHSEQKLRPEYAEALNHLGLLYNDQGKYPQAELLFQRAVTIFEQTLGFEHPYTTSTLDNLALVYKYQGKYEQAEPILQRALTINERTLGPENPLTTNALQHLASLYTLQGRYEEAEPLLLRALALSEQALGREHPQIIYILINLAPVYRDQGRYEEAEPLLQRALALSEQALGREHPDTSFVANQLARLYIHQGRYTQAEPLLQRALALYEQRLGPDHPDIADILANLALLYSLQSRYEQAESLLYRALTIRAQMLGPEHPDTIATFKDYNNLIQERTSVEAATIADPD